MTLSAVTLGSSEDATRERLLREAAQLFARLGYAGVSMRQIAGAAGIRAASIFHHFPKGKSELYEAILRTVTDTMQTRLLGWASTDAGLSAEDRIALTAAAFWDFFAEHPDFAALILRESFEETTQTPESVLAGAEVILSHSRRLIGDAQNREQLASFDVDGFLLWSIMHSVSYHAAPGLRARIVSAGRSVDDDRKHYLKMIRACLGRAGD